MMIGKRLFHWRDAAKYLIGNPEKLKTFKKDI